MDTTKTTPGTAWTGTYRPNENTPGASRGAVGTTGRGQTTPVQFTARAGRPYRGRRRPPYGAALAAVLADPSSWPGIPGTSADGAHLTITVLAGPDAWDVASLWAHPSSALPPCFVVAPPGEDPGRFDWRALARHPPVLVRPCPTLTQGEVGSLVSAMLRDGACRVLVLGDALRLYGRGEVHHG